MYYKWYNDHPYYKNPQLIYGAKGLPSYHPIGQLSSHPSQGKNTHANEVGYQTLLAHLNKIYQEINALKEDNKQLKDELANKKTINVENITNKIQDLNVENLSGSLLVGLSALSDAEELQKFLDDNEAVFLNDINAEQVANNQMKQHQAEDIVTNDDES
ncbi:hypothetical protein [Amphibacillus cookii]|uniref:hypothetical protein n=1 Tax=Amphibacillus cookii TaxID=767787 RepID=UPI00195DF1B0|nr:hypothetical protein [Amphibacillus cookii]MBM7542365.1 CHASE3 domain sensor protein [Amphibacillus cookii]